MSAKQENLQQLNIINNNSNSNRVSNVSNKINNNNSNYVFKKNNEEYKCKRMAFGESTQRDTISFVSDDEDSSIATTRTTRHQQQQTVVKKSLKYDVTKRRQCKRKMLQKAAATAAATISVSAPGKDAAEKTDGLLVAANEHVQQCEQHQQSNKQKHCKYKQLDTFNVCFKRKQKTKLLENELNSKKNKYGTEDNKDVEVCEHKIAENVAKDKLDDYVLDNDVIKSVANDGNVAEKVGVPDQHVSSNKNVGSVSDDYDHFDNDDDEGDCFDSHEKIAKVIVLETPGRKHKSDNITATKHFSRRTITQTNESDSDSGDDDDDDEMYDNEKVKRQSEIIPREDDEDISTLKLEIGEEDGEEQVNENIEAEEQTEQIQNISIDSILTTTTQTKNFMTDPLECTRNSITSPITTIATTSLLSSSILHQTTKESEDHNNNTNEADDDVAANETEEIAGFYRKDNRSVKDYDGIAIKSKLFKNSEQMKQQTKNIGQDDTTEPPAMKTVGVVGAEELENKEKIEKKCFNQSLQNLKTTAVATTIDDTKYTNLVADSSSTNNNAVLENIYKQSCDVSENVIGVSPNIAGIEAENFLNTRNIENITININKTTNYNNNDPNNITNNKNNYNDNNTDNDYGCAINKKTLKIPNNDETNLNNNYNNIYCNDMDNKTKTTDDSNNKDAHSQQQRQQQEQEKQQIFQNISYDTLSVRDSFEYNNNSKNNNNNNNISIDNNNSNHKVNDIMNNNAAYVNISNVEVAAEEQHTKKQMLPENCFDTNLVENPNQQQQQQQHGQHHLHAMQETTAESTVNYESQHIAKDNEYVNQNNHIVKNEYLEHAVDGSLYRQHQQHYQQQQQQQQQHEHAYEHMMHLQHVDHTQDRHLQQQQHVEVQQRYVTHEQAYQMQQQELHEKHQQQMHHQQHLQKQQQMQANMQHENMDLQLQQEQEQQHHQHEKDQFMSYMKQRSQQHQHQQHQQQNINAAEHNRLLQMQQLQQQHLNNIYHQQQYQQQQTPQITMPSSLLLVTAHEQQQQQRMNITPTAIAEVETKSYLHHQQQQQHQRQQEPATTNTNTNTNRNTNTTTIDDLMIDEYHDDPNGTYKLGLSPNNVKHENQDDGYETSAGDVLTPNSHSSSTHSLTPQHHVINLLQTSKYDEQQQQQHHINVLKQQQQQQHHLNSGNFGDENKIIAESMQHLLSTTKTASPKTIHDVNADDSNTNPANYTRTASTPITNDELFAMQQYQTHQHHYHQHQSQQQKMHHNAADELQLRCQQQFLTLTSERQQHHQQILATTASALSSSETSVPPKPPQKRRGRKKKIVLADGLVVAEHITNSILSNVNSDPNVSDEIAADSASVQCLIKSKERKKHDRFNGMSEEEVVKRTLPDHLCNNLDIVIIGINPGLFAAYKGHHYAGPGNHFWKCLYLSGLTQEQMNADEDYKLIKYGIGFTNMVQRATKGSADLTRKEIKEGSRVLLDKLKRFRPKIAVFNGKLIFEVFSGKKDFNFGRQPECVDGTDTHMWVMPSSSARCAQLPRAADKVPFYAALKKFRDYLNGLVPHMDESECIFTEQSIRQCCAEQENLKMLAAMPGLNNTDAINMACPDAQKQQEQETKYQQLTNVLEQDSQLDDAANANVDYMYDAVAHNLNDGNMLLYGADPRPPKVTATTLSCQQSHVNGVVDNYMLASSCDAKAIVPEKKKRGRPKKVKIHDIINPACGNNKISLEVENMQMVENSHNDFNNILNLSIMNSIATTKKKRGRPKKLKLPTTPAAPGEAANMQQQQHRHKAPPPHPMSIQALTAVSHHSTAHLQQLYGTPPPPSAAIPAAPDSPMHSPALNCSSYPTATSTIICAAHLHASPLPNGNDTTIAANHLPNELTGSNFYTSNNIGSSGEGHNTNSNSSVDPHLGETPPPSSPNTCAVDFEPPNSSTNAHNNEELEQHHHQQQQQQRATAIDYDNVTTHSSNNVVRQQTSEQHFAQWLTPRTPTTTHQQRELEQQQYHHHHQLQQQHYSHHHQQQQQQQQSNAHLEQETLQRQQAPLMLEQQDSAKIPTVHPSLQQQLYDDRCTVTSSPVSPHRYQQPQQQHTNITELQCQAQQQHQQHPQHLAPADVASKSLSGLESLVDQIPTIAESEAAAAAAAATVISANAIEIRESHVALESAAGPSNITKGSDPYCAIVSNTTSNNDSSDVTLLGGSAGSQSGSGSNTPHTVHSLYGASNSPANYSVHRLSSQASSPLLMSPLHQQQHNHPQQPSYNSGANMLQGMLSPINATNVTVAPNLNSPTLATESINNTIVDQHRQQQQQFTAESNNTSLYTGNGSNKSSRTPLHRSNFSVSNLAASSATTTPTLLHESQNGNDYLTHPPPPPPTSVLTQPASAAGNAYHHHSNLMAAAAFVAAAANSPASTHHIPHTQMYMDPHGHMPTHVSMNAMYAPVQASASPHHHHHHQHPHAAAAVAAAAHRHHHVAAAAAYAHTTPHNAVTAGIVGDYANTYGSAAAAALAGQNSTLHMPSPNYPYGYLATQAQNNFATTTPPPSGAVTAAAAAAAAGVVGYHGHHTHSAAHQHTHPHVAAHHHHHLSMFDRLKPTVNDISGYGAF